VTVLFPTALEAFKSPNTKTPISRLAERLVFKPTREAGFWCAAQLAAMHHGRFNAHAAYALLSLLIVLVVFLLFQTS
jgi:hypothetical protein